MFGESSTICIPWEPPFCLAEIGALQAGPEHKPGTRVRAPLLCSDIHKAGTFQSTNILGEMYRARMVCEVGCNRVRIVVHTCDNLGNLGTHHAGTLHPGSCTAGTAK